MPSLQQLGKYAIPMGTAALGGGALGYLAYRLSPARYKKLMGTIGAVVGAAAGAYGGYKLQGSLFSPTESSVSSTAKKSVVNTTPPQGHTGLANGAEHPSNAEVLPTVNEVAQYALDDALARDEVVEPPGEEDTHEYQQLQRDRALDLHWKNPIGRFQQLQMRPRTQGIQAFLENPSPFAERGTPVINPLYWTYKGIDAGIISPITQQIPGDSKAVEEVRRAIPHVVYPSLFLTGKGASALGQKVIPTKVMSAVGTTGKALGALGTATDRATAGINTGLNVSRGLDDKYVADLADRNLGEIKYQLGDNANPFDTFMYALNRQATEKALQTAAFGLSVRGTGGVISAMGVNNGLPLTEITAVGKEIARHYKPGQTAREKAENAGMMANLGNLVLKDNTLTGWLKAMSMGYGMDKVEENRRISENKIHGRHINVPATQKNISRIKAEVLAANPELKQDLQSKDLGTNLRAKARLAKLMSPRVQNMAPVLAW